MLSKTPLLKWTSFPAVDFPKKTTLLLIFLSGISLSLYYITISILPAPLLYILGILFVSIELSPYFVETTYEIYHHKLVIKYAFINVERDWNSYKCFYSDKLGVMLGPYKTPRKMDRFRGQSIRFSKLKNEKTELIEFLTNKIGNKF